MKKSSPLAIVVLKIRFRVRKNAKNFRKKSEKTFYSICDSQARPHRLYYVMENVENTKINPKKYLKTERKKSNKCRGTASGTLYTK